MSFLLKGSDNMTFKFRLLHHTIKKIYSIQKRELNGKYV